MINFDTLLKRGLIQRVVRRWTGTGIYSGEQRTDTYVWRDKSPEDADATIDHRAKSDILTSALNTRTDNDTHTDTLHYPMFDIDMEVYVRESSPGKHHVVIDKAISWHTYVNLLDAFVEAGIVEPGYASATIARGFGGIRAPWCEKSRVADEVDPY